MRKSEAFGTCTAVHPALFSVLTTSAAAREAGLHALCAAKRLVIELRKHQGNQIKLLFPNRVIVMTEYTDLTLPKPGIACYHLPGLFAFYDLYAAFLPLYREHREYFYDWCEIGSLYGAPSDCIWGGGRIGAQDCNAPASLALTRKYGISARLTFSNSFLREEHLSDPKCNALCRLFEESSQPQNGVIVHSELLLSYLQRTYPGLYLVSSTTKVLTDFRDFERELSRGAFRYVVPDFRLNKAFAQLDALSGQQKAKVEFLCNECCWFGCRDRKQCYEAVSRKVLGEDGPEHPCTAPKEAAPP